MSRRQQQGPPTDWVTRAADDALRHAHEGAHEGALVTCSSGASPSGPVHLGNLREFLTVHFVADELARRGTAVRHLHVWDDYDRFRKVPAGVDASWADHIGRPLTAVPDPWDCHPSWADHFKEPLRDALHALGVDMSEVSQTERYRAGHYREQVLHAVRHRDQIDEVLARYRTKGASVAELAQSEQEAAALEESVADADDAVGGSDLARFPFKPYCRGCGRDTVTLTSYDDDTTDLAYTCECGDSYVTNLATQDEGKLVWKVDWPMRWAVEHVDFEPAGMDHATPGSSFTVGHELVESVFGMPRPAWFGYGFVGFAGVQKMSSSAGGAPTAADALRVLEAPVLRWLYVRRNPKQTFDIDFGPEVVRLYDEWDALGRKAESGKRDGAVLAHERAAATASAGTLPVSAVTVPFRVLSSVADVTAGSADQISRIVSDLGYPHARCPTSSRGCRRRCSGRRSSCPPPTGRPSAPSPTRSPWSRCPRRSRSGSGCCSRRCPSASSRSTTSPRSSTASPSWRAASASTTPRPTRSRRTSGSSSGCSTTCWSTPSAARASPP